ncbi:hypothetical protein Q7P37_004744 [Cladosporium fusiforme]
MRSVGGCVAPYLCKVGAGDSISLKNYRYSATFSHSRQAFTSAGQASSRVRKSVPLVQPWSSRRRASLSCFTKAHTPRREPPQVSCSILGPKNHDRDVWCLITGVSPDGLGDALATELLKRPNIHVIVTGLNISDLDHLSESTRLAKVQLDVTSSSSISAAVETVARITGGRLDYLVNNAGYGYMMPLLDADFRSVRHNFEVNVFGLLAVTQACFPLLREAQGTVVNQCSIASLSAGRQPYIGSYSATKAAVATLNDTMRVEFAPFGVHVVSLVTGAVETSFWRSQAAASRLPVSSLYAPIGSHVESMMRGENVPPGQRSREVWASGVAKDILTSSPPRFVRHGALAWAMVIISFLLPVWLCDYMFSQTTRLSDLKRKLDSEGMKKDQ